MIDPKTNIKYSDDGKTLIKCPNNFSGHLEVPDSVTEIRKVAFWGCHSLTSITIPDSIKQIGDGAFAFCESLTSITIPNGVTLIGNDTFHNCKSLTSITIPNSVMFIAPNAFSYCDRKNIIFHVQKGSYADTWAKKNGYKVKYDINPPTNPPSDSLASTSFFS